ncbi:general secretion pathway protein G [Candidatus Photodesmus katoptron]|uniref:Type II secretion system core protein G n=1 Tax=Candidatus Photodesmus katoptron Akat1 TaxID=1236703 RepID=S3DK54_9GAMM|nr:type II secretion system major pseudopilin GspG [Candidatus Photodesmus katoptron]EPE37529.1 general secretion pathway protein G [Candidatus Photodesmus katoptron Akat1]KEY90179.1 general secretion pathway protein G [Candidatus Photodesmus katoptron]
MKKETGFTLLEVMIVVVIIGILASFVVPNLLIHKEKADQQKAITDIVALENALEMYKLDHSVYPTTQQGLEILLADTKKKRSKTYRDIGYIKRLPKDPWGNNYQYINLENENNRIKIFTFGADGEEGGEGVLADIGNWNIQDFL